MKKISYILLVVISSVLICCESTTINLRDWQVGLEIDSVSFQGDWSAYKTNGVDNLKISMNLEDTSNTPIKLKLPINYIGNQPAVSVSNDKYVLNGNGDWRDSSTLIIESEFKRSNNMDLSPDLTGTDSKSLNNEYYYKLNLKYNADNNSVLDIDIVGKNWNLIPNGFNFNVNYKVVHDATADGGKLNLIVMAEGYRADQMDDYKAYVDYAFQDTAHFHYLDKYGNHIDNDFFAKYWNKIRVIRMDTISPQSGVDHNWYEDNVHTILNYNIEGAWQGCDFSRITHIMSMTKPCGLEWNDADAYIIFVNDKTTWTYSWSYGFEIGYKYGQPIHPVITQAPVGYDVSADNFHAKIKSDHEGVTVNAIAHELGHALARLQDEYTSSYPYGTYNYCWWFRNIDDDISDCKWQKLIDKGYGGGNSKNNLVGNFHGALYQTDKNYRPTYNSTMNRSSKFPFDTTNDNYQFGPVNTYHLTASLKIRTSESDPVVGDLGCTNYSDVFYEWKHYSIDDFCKEWSPSDFEK